MDKQTLAENVVTKMMGEDAFSQLMGMKVLEVRPGFVKLTMKIRPEMNNGFRVVHGGVIFSLADSALAFASNSHGRVALAIENNISFMEKVQQQDRLTATTEELSIGRRVGVYNVSIRNQRDEEVALFRGTVYRTAEQHFPSETADS